MSEKAPPERERFGGASLCVGDEPKGPAECLHSRGLLATAIIECPQGMRRIGAAGLSRVAKTPCSIPGDEPKDPAASEKMIWSEAGK